MGRRENASRPRVDDRRGVPDGAPKWVTAELISDTAETWQPYYKKRLTETDALEIIMGVGRLLDILEPTR